jgi:hypothetical protein
MTGTSRPCQRYSRGPAKLKDGFRIMFRLLYTASERFEKGIEQRQFSRGLTDSAHSVVTGLGSTVSMRWSQCWSFNAKQTANGYFKLTQKYANSDRE